MLRNDGELFECPLFGRGDGRMAKHPYLIGLGEIESKKDLYQFALESLHQGALQWFYTHTKNESTKKLILELMNFFVTNDETKKVFVKFKNDFPITGEEKKISLADAVSVYKELEAELNQEFCRVRTSDMYYGGNGKDIYFRISSAGFNWFNLIWTTVYENRNFISSVTVVTDPDSHKTESEEFYSHNGEVLDHIPTEEFITLSGRPVIESLSVNKKRLANGSSLYDAYNHTRPDRIYSYYMALMGKELETREL